MPDKKPESSEAVEKPDPEVKPDPEPTPKKKDPKPDPAPPAPPAPRSFLDEAAKDLDRMWNL